MDQYFLSFRKVRFLTVPVQMVLVVLLYVATVLVGYQGFLETGLLFGYPVSVSILFVPIYEEVLFRGFLLGELMKKHSEKMAIVLSSLLFGLWHLKNIFFLSLPDLIVQILYTGLVFGPMMACLTIKSRSIWPAVLIHYVNNLFSSPDVFERFLSTY